jgi:biopolymer transport protein TolR
VRDAQGALAEERRLARGELARAIRERQAKNPDRPVLIAADKDVRYEAVLNVMDELQRQQVRRIGLLVQPAK